jgi:hypothetical protein
MKGKNSNKKEDTFWTKINNMKHVNEARAEPLPFYVYLRISNRF